MNSTRRISLTLALVGALVLFGGATAQTQTTNATVTATNTMTLSAGGTLSFTPTVASADQDATTTLDFETNDGKTYKISVVGNTGGWSFTPSVTGTAANTYPLLKFVSATATAGTASTTAGNLINTDNTLGVSVAVVTGITNAKGSATVTLEASITQTVVAGSYAASLTYTFAAP